MCCVRKQPTPSSACSDVSGLKTQEPCIRLREPRLLGYRKYLSRPYTLVGAQKVRNGYDLASCIACGCDPKLKAMNAAYG